MNRVKVSQRILIVALLLLWGNLFAAWLENMPTTVYQPNNEALNCFASGDEYHNWLHDKDGYTIIRDTYSGELRYAEKAGDRVVAGKLVAGKDDPRSAGLEPNVNISEAEYKLARANKFHSPDLRDAPTTGTLNNLVVFIRFSDEAEYGENLSLYNGWFNSNTSSLKNYFSEVSYNQLTVNTHFFPSSANSYVLSWQDSHPRSYYQPYDATTNPGGYQNDTQSRDREFTLLQNASYGVESDIPTNLNIDADGDGRVDNVVFIVKGSAGEWSSLLWPHRWSLWDRYVYIRGKRVYDFNFQLQNFLVSQNVGVLCHEFYHSLGAPDLYHYSHDGISPAGSWDLMNSNTNPPQHMTTYMKMKYGGWVDSIPTLSADGEYSLNPVTSQTGQAYRIDSNVAGQYYVLEFRKQSGTFESSIPESGIIIYRIDTTTGMNGNADGPPDELYIYRPGGTTTSNGSVYDANFSAEAGRTAINNTTNPSPFLQDGSAGNLKVYNIGSASGSTINFSKGDPEPVIWDFSQADYQESFEQSSFPEGWINTVNTGTHMFEIVSSGTYPSCNPFDGSRMLMYNSYNAFTGHSASLNSPILRIGDPDGFDFSLKFNMYRDSGYSSNADRIEVLLADPAEPIQNAQILGTIHRSSSLSPAVPTNGWYSYSFDLDIQSPGDYYLVFKATSAYGNRIYLDNFRFVMNTIVPYTQNFDTLSVPELPFATKSIVNSSSTSAYLRTISSTVYSYSPPNALAMANSADPSAELVFQCPKLPGNLGMYKARFWARATANGTLLEVGSTDADDVFTPITSLNLTNVYRLYEVNFAGQNEVHSRIAFKHGVNATYRTIYLDDLEFLQIPDYDLSVLHFDVASTVTLGNALPLSVEVGNQGLQSLANYRIGVYNSATDEELGFWLPGTSLASGMQVTHQLGLNFGEAGSISLYAVVTHAQDAFQENNSSQVASVAILPADFVQHTVGESYPDDLQNYMPFNFFYKNSVAESIYYPDDGLSPGSTVYAISYPYDFVSEIPQTPLKLWIMETTVEELGSGWLAPQNYQLAFDGYVNIPAGSGNLIIPLSEPFEYNGGNFAIRTNRPLDSIYYSSSDRFSLFDSGNHPNRSRRLNSDATEYDPLAPSAIGTASALAPKISLLCSPSSVEYINLSTLAFNTPLHAVVNSETELVVQIENAGNTAVQEFTIQIHQAADDSVIYTNTYSMELLADAQLELQLPLTFTEPGIIDVYASVSCAEDSILADNYSAIREIIVLEENTQISLIGYDEEIEYANTLPFNFFYKNSVAETIYLSSELNLPEAQIEGIEFPYDFVQDIAGRELKVWLKNTDDTSLGADFPAFEGYSLVYDLPVDLSVGERSLYLPFDIPFTYTGGNLAIRTNRVMDSQYFNSANRFKQYEAGAGRSIYLRSDSIQYEPTSALSGATISSKAPLITVHYREIILSLPEISISRHENGIRLDWQALENANSYKVLISIDMENWIEITTTENWFIYQNAPKAFFKVIASSALPQAVLRADPYKRK